MVHTENQLINASVMKMKRLLCKLQQKELFTDQQITEVKQIISSLGVDSGLKIPIVDNPIISDFYPLYESLENRYEPSQISPSSPEKRELSESPEPIYATINKTPTNSRKKRVQLNLESFQQKVRTEIEKGCCNEEQPRITDTPKKCKVAIHDSPKVEKVQLTEKNIESFKNYVNNNLFNSTFNSVCMINDDSVITNRDALNLTSRNGCASIQEKFVVNLYESRPSKRWQKKEAVALKKRIDNNFTTVKDSHNQSANIDNTNNMSECLDNFYSVLSSPQTVDAVNDDVYQTMEDLTPLWEQQQDDAKNHLINEVIAPYRPNETSRNSFYKTMSAEDPPYYSEVDANHDQNTLPNEITHNYQQDDFFRLKQNADIQCNIMKQAYKAIETCRKSKKFCNGVEKVTAEKILLLANQRHASLIQTIRASQYDNIILTPKVSTTSNPPTCNYRIGKTTIRNMSFPLSNLWLSSNYGSSKYHNWFLVVASEGDRMLASEAVLVKPGERYVEVKQTFEFDRLDADFRVEVGVYHMRLRGEIESDWTIGGELRFNKRVSTLYRSFRKLHYKDLQTHTLVANDIPSSGFTKCGSIMITVHDLLATRANWKLTLHSPTNTLTSISSNYNNQTATAMMTNPVEDIFSMDVTVQKTDLQIKRSGFLTVGTEASEGTVWWNRKWCVLNGTSLHFHNDPMEADCYKVTLSLKNSLATSIEVAPRSVCSKPMTLLLDTVRAKDNGTIRHFLNADSRLELEAWSRDFNTVIVLLKNWNELPHARNLVTDL